MMTNKEALNYVEKIEAARAAEDAILEEIRRRADYEQNEEKDILYIVGQREQARRASAEAQTYLSSFGTLDQ